MALDVPPGLRAVTVKVQNPGAQVANPPIADVSARVVDGQVLVDLPGEPAANRRFHFGTDGTFTYPFNTNTQSGGSEIVLPRIKITAMTTFGAGGATVAWRAPAVETFTGFFNINEIPCTPDDPDATILSTTVTDTLAIPLNPYTDVPGGLDPAVSWARHLKVYKPAGTHFSPSTGVTRSEAVVALWNLVDRPQVDTGNPFTDVPANATYRAALDWAVSEGVVADTGNHKFKPTAPLLRGPLVDLAFRTLHAQDGSPWPAFAYTDVSSGASYAEALRWADDAGVINEYAGGTKVKPTVAATRSDLAKLLFAVANDGTWFRPLPTTVLVAPA